MQIIYCTNCGAPNNLGTHFCTKCGQKLTPQTQEEKPKQTKKNQVQQQPIKPKKKKGCFSIIGKIILGLVILFTIGVILLLAFDDSSQTDDDRIEITQNNSIIGTWRFGHEQTGYFYWTFNEDGTFIFKDKMNEDQTPIRGQYSIEGNKLILTNRDVCSKIKGIYPFTIIDGVNLQFLKVKDNCNQSILFEHFWERE